MPAAYNNGSGYFLYVGDITEVYNYTTPQGSTMFFMNKNEPVLYIKSVNMFNQQTITTYDLVERKQTVPPIYSSNEGVSRSSQSPNDYVTREELASVIQDTIRNEFRNSNKSFNKQRREEQ